MRQEKCGDIQPIGKISLSVCRCRCAFKDAGTATVQAFDPLGHKVGRRGLTSTLTRNLVRAVLRLMSRPCGRRNSIALQHDGEASEIADFVAYLPSPSAGVIPSASTGR